MVFSLGNKLGAIDVGTNSTRLLLVELLEEGKYKDILRRAIITRLGEGVEKTHHLSFKAVERTIETLVEYKRLLEEKGAAQFKAVATAVLRKTEDASSFLLHTKGRVGFDIEILEAFKEAELAFLGATYDLQLVSDEHQPVLVIDVGGGSTELIFGSGVKLYKLFSLSLGCVNLTEMFLKTDPPLPSELKEAKDYVRDKVYDAVSEIKKLSAGHKSQATKLIGVAGTITTLSAINQRMLVYTPSLIHGSKLSKHEIDKLLKKLLILSLGERREVRGLEPARADVIVAGTLILTTILENLGLDEITVSEHDILDGIILEQLKNQD